MGTVDDIPENAGTRIVHTVSPRRATIARSINNSTGSVDIVLYYVLFGICWILLSDILVSRLVTDTALFSAISIAKGWLFIATTALLLHVLIKRRLQMASRILSQHMDEIAERERRILYCNRLYSVLSAVNRSIIRISGRQELLDEICRIMVTTGGFKMAWVGKANADGLIIPEARCGDDFGYLDSISISNLDIPEGRGPTGAAIRERKAVICNDIASNPTMVPWREAALENGFASSACFPFALPDGSIAGLTIYSPVADFFSEDEKRLLCEVSEDMEYALQMLHTAAAHRVAEQRFKEVIDNSPAAIYAFDRDGRLLLANAAMAATCGMAKNDLYGRRREEIGISQESAQLQHENDLSVLNSGEAQLFEETNLLGDGMHTYLTVKFPLTTREDGAMTTIAGISTDITGHKRAEEELHSKNAEIEQFIYTVSHDLRTPLVTIKTFMGYLEKDVADNNRGHLAEDIRFIHSAADKMRLLLDSLLEMSRIDRVETQPSMVSFREILDDTLDSLAGVIKERTVEIHLPATELMLFGDRSRFYQIWMNLIENAIKFSRAGSIPRIELGTGQIGGDTVFFVKDNGIGISPEYLAKVFGIFEKLDQKSRGAGLGLSMVKRAIEKCGGRIWAESEGSGKGSCFHFTLPQCMVQN